jgi:hypothetical protein
LKWSWSSWSEHFYLFDSINGVKSFSSIWSFFFKIHHDDFYPLYLCWNLDQLDIIFWLLRKDDFPFLATSKYHNFEFGGLQFPFDINFFNSIGAVKHNFIKSMCNIHRWSPKSITVRVDWVVRVCSRITDSGRNCYKTILLNLLYFWITLSCQTLSRIFFWLYFP